MAGRDMLQDATETELRQMALKMNDALSQLRNARSPFDGDDFEARSTGRSKGNRRCSSAPSPLGNQNSSRNNLNPKFRGRGSGIDRNPNRGTAQERGRGRGRFQSRGRSRGKNWNRDGSYQPQRYWGQPDPLRQYEEEPWSPNPPVALNPKVLVDALIKSRDLTASLLELMEQWCLSPSAVRETVTQYPKVFDLNGEKVELRPEIVVCSHHSDPEGCRDRSACRNIHICQQYIRNLCKDSYCVFGHKWRTDHNIAVLRSYFIEHIPVPILQKILVQPLHTVAPVGKIAICFEYNTKGCIQDDCTSLHICQSFVACRTRCQQQKCQLNHDPLTPQCCKVLSAHGFSTNETPRDIVVAILAANSEILQQDTKQNTVGSHETKSVNKGESKNTEKRKEESEIPVTNEGYMSKDSEKRKEDSEIPVTNEGYMSKDSEKRKEESEIPVTNEGYMSKDSDDASSDDENDVQSTSSLKSEKTNEDSVPSKTTKIADSNTTKLKHSHTSSTSLPKSTPVSIKTYWTQDVQGNVAVPEICYYSVEGMCRDEGSGCKRLHSSEHFHWQVMKQNEYWYNLPEQQVITLERSFCNPDEDCVDLPRLDPTHLRASARGLLILMGRDTWTASFSSMSLTNSSKSQILKIRRLCTQYIDGQEIKPSNFIWYFLDIKKNWVQYGLSDTTGETNLIVNATSKDIEREYRQNPASTYSFKSTAFHYVLDFKSMTQTNQKTNVVRQVRRRPEPHLKDQDEDSEDEKPKDLPSSWEIMQPEERVRMVTLAPSSSEYQTVTALLNGRISTSNVIKIERVQNPYLWRAFGNKITEMSSVLGDKTKVDIRHLFHGTNHNVVSSICAENFDWRLHGSSSGQAYGRGTYFSTDAAYSYSYCGPDGSGMKYLFVAQVAVGTFTRGNSSMVRPPPNPATGMLYDSTVDQENMPKIIVKYDKQEYFPEYILTLV
ncbi:protein mono-ADP-ribosyltransferase PARP12-like [Penaeus indicus]|uniref:protein mono-ADP-ribosyltransferase PARP12-like n=1 Tax=Penaeus indicus TaxID=29960 RepID=UPI00300C1BEA